MESLKIEKIRPTLHSVTGGMDDSFVGIKANGNEIHIYHPESYPLDVESDCFKHDVIALLKTISIAKTPSKEHVRICKNHLFDSDFALSSYIWLINDFLSRGFYVNKEKVFRVNENGKINWKKTMQSNSIISKKSIIFPNITIEKQTNVDNVLVDIHKLCVKKSIDSIGWIFGLNSKSIQSKKLTKSLKKYYIEVVKNELKHTFLDDKKILLRHMNNVLVGLNEEADSNNFVYGVDSYYYVFERMVDSVFGNVENISEFYPSSMWHIKGKEPIEGSKLRPDTVYIKNSTKNAFILDSKYYRYGFSNVDNDLPETSSIQKQITYGEYIRENYKENSKLELNGVFNAFILPYDKNKGDFKSNENIQYIGYSESTWKTGEESYEKVYAFLIDLHYLIKTWNRKNHESDINKITEIMEKLAPIRALQNSN